MNRIKHHIEHYKKFIELLNPCMDDYLYIYDVQADRYQISEGALERFPIPDTEFTDVANSMKRFVYPEDLPILLKDMQALAAGEKDYHNIRYRWLDKRGNPIWINCRGIMVRDEEKNAQYLIGCVNEIGLKQEADNVSGLLTESSLQQELKKVKDQRCKGFILRLGIDKFKEINEDKGIDYGNMILRKTAECIRKAILPDQQLFRVVADEFVILDTYGRDLSEAKMLYEQIRLKINKFIESTGYEVFFTMSAGILEFSKVKNKSYTNIMKLSEFAMNSAKEAGRNQYCVFIKEDYQKFQEKKELVQVIRRAIMNGFEGFEVYFQPIVDIQSNTLVSAEALLRFRAPGRGMISPMEFIPLLEESGLIIPVGKWVLHQSMEACSRIQQKVPDFHVSVNLSYIQVMKSDVLNDILLGVRQFGLQPGSITMELTESGYFEMNSPSFTRFCNGLKKNGVALAFDDFGTGYSNFNYLYALSPDTIKVDRSLTVKALQNEHEYRLLQHMIDMSHSVDIKFCVEGIETKEDLDKISMIHPDLIQGYYFGKPCTYEDFMKQFVDFDDMEGEQKFMVLKRNPLPFEL